MATHLRRGGVACALRALLVAVLVLPLAGCLEGDEGPRLAQPTDKPLVLPNDEPVRPTGARYDLNDPGYVVTGSWRVGDGWDYESNKSSYRRLRVVDERKEGVVTYFRVEETSGRVGSSATLKRSLWVDGRAWLVVNATSGAASEAWKPGLPLRHWRNASTTFDHTTTSSGATASESVQLTSRLLPNPQSVLFPWGYVEAKRVEQRLVTRGANNATAVSIETHWPHRDYLNDVQYLVDGELFKLTGARVGDFRRGTLAT